MSMLMSAVVNGDFGHAYAESLDGFQGLAHADVDDDLATGHSKDLSARLAFREST